MDLYPACLALQLFFFRAEALSVVVLVMAHIAYLTYIRSRNKNTPCSILTRVKIQIILLKYIFTWSCNTRNIAINGYSV